MRHNFRTATTDHLPHNPHQSLVVYHFDKLDGLNPWQRQPQSSRVVPPTRQHQLVATASRRRSTECQLSQHLSQVLWLLLPLIRIIVIHLEAFLEPVLGISTRMRIMLLAMGVIVIEVQLEHHHLFRPRFR
jgi:hypothetical protein